MTMALRCVRGAALALTVTGAMAQSPPQKKLPLLVQKEVAGMMGMCKEVGGKPQPSPGLLLVADLSGDGLPDYVIDQSAFVCDGAASLFGGSGGSQVSAYVGTPDGQARQAFAGGTFGVQLNQGSQPATLELMVGGELCGQKVTAKMSRAEYKPCWRPLRWIASTRQLDFAPLSQIRPVQ